MINAMLLQALAIRADKNIIDDLLTFIYSLAHQLGVLVIKDIQFLFPRIDIPNNIVDALGFMILLTLFVILAQAAKKIATIILIVGWGLLFIRIILLLIGVM